jgi:hypothetical protein
MKGFRKIMVLTAAVLALMASFSACSSLRPFTQDEVSRISGIPMEQPRALLN